MRTSGIPHWQYRILKALGLNPFSPQAVEALAGVSKHSRARRPARDWREKRKAANRQARASRKRNRMVTNQRKSKRQKRAFK